MKNMILYIFFSTCILPVLVQASCNDQHICGMCANTGSWIGSCRWCEKTRSCHAYGSTYNECKMCDDSTSSPLCSITEAWKCGKNAVRFDAAAANRSLLISAVAYSDEPGSCIKKVLPSDDIEIVEVIGRKCVNLHFMYKECFALIAVSKRSRQIFLAYRGTVSISQLTGEILSTFRGRVSSKIGGKVHAYFSNANKQLYDCVKEGLSDTLRKYSNYEVVIAGHSLGGALASVASADLHYDGIIETDQTTLYTFGMPRPGDETFARKHDEIISNSYRVVHYRDVVAKVPPRSLGSFHHQLEIFYRADMKPSSSYTICYQYEDPSCRNSFSTHSFANHLNYYEINVGSHCDSVLRKRRKRSDEESDMSHLFTNDQCRRIKGKDILTNSAHSHHGITGLSMLLILMVNA